MNIDIRTMIIITGITNILQIIVIFYQYLANKHYPGLGWWVLGFISLLMGFVLLALRGTIPVQLITVIIANVLVLMNSVFLYIGILRFLDRRENRPLLASFIALFVLSFSYFTYVKPDITFRTIIIYTASAMVMLSTVYSLLSYKGRSFRETIWFNAVLFLVMGCFLIFRAAVTLTVDPVSGLFTATMMQSISFLFFFVQGILLTFGLIIMVNQRLNAENSESRENLEQIFNTSPDAVLVTRLNDGKFAASNDGFTSMTGFERADVAGRSILDFQIWVNLSDREKMIAALTEKGFCNDLESVFQRKDGVRFNGTLSAKIINLQGVAHIISVTQDITARKQAELAIQESESLYRTLIENAGQGIVVVQNGRIAYANRSLERIMGFSAKDMQSIPFTEFLHPDDRDMVFRYYQKRLSGDIDIPSVYKFRVLVKDGSILWFEINAVMIEWKGLPATLNFLTDLSERQRTEEALRQSEERHRLLAENATDVIWTMDFGGHFTYVSPSAEKMRGYSVDEILKQSFDDMLTPESAAIARVRLSEAIDDLRNGMPGQTFREELEQPCKDGSTIWTESTISGLYNNTGELIGILGASRDITERRRTENLIRARLELLEFAASHAINDVLQKTLDQVCELTGSLIGFYHFVESDQKTLSLQAWSTRTLQEFCKTEGYGMHYPIEEAGVWVDCVHTRKPVIHNDYATLPHRKGMPEGHAPVIRELVVPIIKSGIIVSILGVGNKSTDYTEKDTQLVSFFADIAWEVAERKRAEAALIESESRYAMTLNAVNEGIWDWNVQNNHVFFSPQYYKILGYDDAEFEPSEKAWRNLVHPDDLNRVEEELRKSVESGESFLIDFRIKMKSGRFIWVRANGNAVFHDAEGKTVRMVGTLSDITDRKQSEIYHTLDAAVLEILNASEDFQKSVRQILTAIQEATGCDAVGIRLQKDNDYPYYDQIGFPNEFLRTENSLLSCGSCSTQNNIPGKDIIPECICGLVLSGKTNPLHPLCTQGGSFWTRNMSALSALPGGQDLKFHPRNQCMHHGYVSLVLVPIRARQKIIGLLQLGERRKNQFNPDTVAILESIANHVGETLVRKQAEDALKESEEKYRSILENMTEGYFESDSSGRITFANDAGLYLMGYEPHEREKVYRSHYRQYTTPETYENMKTAYRQVYQTGQSRVLDDYEIVRRDGSIRTHQMSVVLIRDASGNKTGFRTVVRDITERKQTEDALKESEERFRQLAEVFPETIFEADFAGRMTYANQHGLDKFHLTQENIDAGINIIDLVAQSDRSKARQRIENRLKGMTGGFLEYKAQRLDGANFDAMCYLALMNKKGKTAGFRGFILDITERKQAEALILEARDKAEEVSRAKSEFLSMMSHEIRTPLNAIIGMSELLEETRLDEEQKKYVHTFKNAGESLLHIINDILDYSKIEAGKIELERVPFDLIGMVKSTSEIMAMQARQKGVQLIVDIRPDVPGDLTGDQQRLRQVLINLIGNAIKFTEKGEISVRLEKIDENARERKCTVRFSVTDTGIGIPREKLEYIFEHFSQADTSVTRKFGGTGLGLAICKKLIELMGGQILVESRVGKGSRFYFTLPFDLQVRDETIPPEGIPANQKAPSLEKTREGAEDLSAVSPQQMRPLNILHIEDAENNRMIIRSYFKKTPFLVDEAVNGQIGLDKFKAGHYDLVLMDMQMPLMDGYTATREIRKWEKEKGLREVPILALTAHVLKEDVEKSLAAGCTGHLTKPIKKSDLIQAITAHVPWNNEKISITISHELEDLIPLFMENTRKDIHTINDALVQNDLETIRRIGHSMKSYGTGYGFDSVSALGRKIERAAADLNTVLVRQSIHELTDYLDRVVVVYDR